MMKFKLKNRLNKSRIKACKKDCFYPDRSDEILSNPILYKKLVDAWGDLANED